MKKILFLFFTALGVFSLGQGTDEILFKRMLRADSLKLVLQTDHVIDQKLSFYDDARNLLHDTITNVLKSDDFKNENLQQTLLQPLTKYSEAFEVASNGKVVNNLRFRFDNKEDFIEHYKLAESVMLSKMVEYQYQLLIKKTASRTGTIDHPLDKNLNRLGISKAQYEKLSDHDKKVLETRFE